jgi:poly(A) polymerase
VTVMSLRPQDAQIAIAKDIGHLLVARGFRDTYLVGGYVRALVMGTVTHDFDVVVVGGDAMAATRSISDALGADFYILDAERGYGRVIGNEPLAATHWQRFTVDVTPALGGAIETDLSRRDFSIDAMAVPMLAPGDTLGIIDPQDGRSDISGRLIRALNDDIFRDDPARLLRLVRLASQLDFDIDDHTAVIAKTDAPRIREASPDRQRDEFCRIFSLGKTAEAVIRSDEFGLLSQIFPELDDSRGVDQPREHYWDVFTHLIETVRAFDIMLDGSRRDSDPVIPSPPWPDEVSQYFAGGMVDGRSRGALTKLACLFHDVAKPQTKSFEPDGRMRFFGHGEEGAKIAAQVMERLHFSRREISFVSAVITHHLRPVQLSQDLAPPSKRALDRYRDALGDSAIATMYLSMADYLAAKGPMLDPLEWQTRVKYCEGMLNSLLHDGESDGVRLRPLVDGHSLMKELGIPSGKPLGRILASIREAEAVGEVETSDQAFALARRLIQETPIINEPIAGSTSGAE